MAPCLDLNKISNEGTPIFIVAFSSLYFTMGYAPEGTKNEGVFFNEYFDVSDMEIYSQENKIEFTDGKWILGVYVTDEDLAKNSLYLMRQLNIALNRDIFKINTFIIANEEYHQ